MLTKKCDKLIHPTGIFRTGFKIAALSSGKFVGILAGNPEQKIALKIFHSAIQNDHEAMVREEAGYKAFR
jgi:hypothetical protein